jgi:hypothetical protein
MSLLKGGAYGSNNEPECHVVTIFPYIFLLDQPFFAQSSAPPQFKMQTISNIIGLIYNNIQVGTSC